MAAIYDVANGVTVWDEEDVNQYGATFNNVLGITDTAQDALGRLVLPRSSAAPASPSEAEVYYDTDDDRAYMQNGSGVWVPLGFIRQMISVRLNSGDIALGTSDTTVISQSVTTTGGQIWLMGTLGWGDGNVASVAIAALASMTLGRSGAEAGYDFPLLISNDFSTSLAAFGSNSGQFTETPAAGTYTYYLKGKRTNFTGLNAKTGGCYLTIIEFG